MVILPALCLTITTSIIILFIYPHSNNLRIHIYENAIHETTIQKLSPHQFNKLGKEGVVYTQNISKNRQKLLNIFFVQNANEENEPDSFDIIVATKAEENTNLYNQKLLNLSNGMRYIGNLNQNNWKMVEFQKYTKVLKTAKLRLEDWPGCLSTTALIAAAKHDRYAAAELHWRIAIPISLLILTFFALLLSDTTYQRNKIFLYLPAVIIYFIYIDLIFTGMSFIKNETVGSKLGLWWTHALMLMAAIFFILYRYFFKEMLLWKRVE
jgi:lipopolysaccharide export system permease protein